uniref:non-specific serine/threonine protein kinase n=1 Tax=Hordeum vulgare subsp. vulgare TaxID=112509 RepID=F2DGZ2_HORVV|nr:predicted protein [Hordeum vulgare subsp. vulgare]
MVGVLLLLVLLMPASATAIGITCGSGRNNTANTTFQSSLAVLSATLPANASSSPQLFATATAGVVRALALCRRDTVNTTACTDCLASSFKYAQKMCPNRKTGATVYYDYDEVNALQPGCILGFSGDAGFLGPATNTTRNVTFFQYWNPVSLPGNARVIAAAVRELLNETARDAAAAPRGFATAFMDSIGGAAPTPYSLAQCTPDLSARDCLACLRRLVGAVNATYSVRMGGRMFVLRCNIRFEAFMFYDDKNMRRIPFSSPSSMAPAPAPAPTGHGVRPWVIALSVAAPVALVALCCFIVCCCRLRKRQTKKGKVALHEKSSHQFQGDELVWEMEAELSEFSVYEFHQILEATDNFSEENKLGEGGFGPVYKGHFPEGIEIAVKRLDSDSDQGFIEFKNEVELIAKLQHRNLVRLMGCCSQGEEKVLVYEYLPNKSLDFFIFDEDRKVLLDWEKRLVIIVGIAEGLLYLHKHSRLRVIHRDLKPSNILLDSTMNAKISDFGLAKIFSSNNNEGNKTRKVVGTYGYMAPEYASHGLFSVKSDVFSFGVLVLEIISGKKNSHECGAFINLIGYAWQLFEEERWTEIVDAALVPNGHSSEMMRSINIALLCVQEDAIDRPTMLDVVAMLSSKTMILNKPKHPAYYSISVGNNEAAAAAKSSSFNDVTISTITPR